MKNVLIIQYPGISHLNGGFNVSNTLKSLGYQISYFISEELVDYIKQNGFNYIISKTRPVLEAQGVVQFEKTIAYGYFSRLRDQSLGLNFENRRQDLFNALRQVSPNIIIVDSYAGSDFIFLYQYILKNCIKFYYLDTMLCSLDIANVPYINSKLLPKQRLLIYFDRLLRQNRKRMLRIFNKLIFLNHDTFTSIQKEIKKERISVKHLLDDSNYMQTTFTNISTLVTAPRELEFLPFLERKHRFYLGLYVNKNDLIRPISERLAEILSLNQKLIYISFGTIFVKSRFNDILRFLHILNFVLASFDNVQAVITYGGKSSILNLQKFSRIHSFDFLPQLYVLSKTTLFITHGGLNSIKESIYHDVPMLVYPLETDQVGNSRKIVYHGFGLNGNIRTDNKHQLESKIKRLLLEDIFKFNIQMFKQEVDFSYDIENTLTNLLNEQGVIY